MNSFAGMIAMATPTGSGAGAQPGAGSLMQSQLPFLVLLFVIFYFVLIRPQQKKAKQQAQMLKTLKSGDKVVTAAGLIGVVVTVKDNTVTLRSADSKFEVTKSSVTEIIPTEGSSAS